MKFTPFLDNSKWNSKESVRRYLVYVSSVTDKLFSGQAETIVQMFIQLNVPIIQSKQYPIKVVLTAMNRFINEADGSQTAFLDGNQPDRLCAPMVQHIQVTF